VTRWLDYLTPVEITTEVLDHFSHPWKCHLNKIMEVNVEYAKENNRHELAEGSGTDASNFQTHLGPATATAADLPRGSTDTLRSLDITHNIPKVIVPMDSEESPWGGLSALGYILPNVLSERLICYFRCTLAIKFQRKSHKSWGK